MQRVRGRRAPMRGQLDASSSGREVKGPSPPALQRGGALLGVRFSPLASMSRRRSHSHQPEVREKEKIESENLNKRYRKRH